VAGISAAGSHHFEAITLSMMLLSFPTRIA
jgi:hypothetical protein